MDLAKYILSGILIMVCLVGTVNAANCGGTVPCNCGDTVTSDYVMTGDLTSCTGNGLSIGTDSITIDCSGYTISGSGSGYGIHLQHRKYAIVKNCNIQTFGIGIYIQGTPSGYSGSSNNNELYNNNITNNNGGIYISSCCCGGSRANNNTIGYNNISNNSQYGISISYCAYYNNIFDNIINDNGDGIKIQHSNNEIINSNTACWNILDFNILTTGNSGTNNTCTTRNNWNDINAAGCTYPCSDTDAPELSIEYPQNNSEISGFLEIAANASDNYGISRVEFYKNNSLLCNVTGKPYTCLWDTTNESNGNYTITIKAYDNFNNENISEINVFVNNKAELVINSEDIFVSPQNPLENKTVTIAAIVKNIGTLDADNVTVKFLIDGNLINSTILNISANSSAAAEFNWTGILGEYNVTIVVDSKNATVPVLVRNCVVPSGDFYVNEDTLLCQGIYNDTNIIVNANGVVLDCNGAVLEGNGSGYGIYLENKDNVTIKNCNVMNYSFGILLNSSSNNTINNSILNSNKMGLSLTYSSNNNEIVNNTANSNYWFGISLISSLNNNIANNIANLNSNAGDYGSGIWLESSSNNAIINNIANSNNINGILLKFSSNNTMIGNSLKLNGLGIDLSYSSNNTLQENEISNNTIGIYSQNSTTTINSNTVCSNNLDFNSSNWLNTSGTNNTCDTGNWNDASAWGGGCKYSCFNNCTANVAVTADKEKYMENETIKITANSVDGKNFSYKSIGYTLDYRTWEIYKYKNDSWVFIMGSNAYCRPSVVCTYDNNGSPLLMPVLCSPPVDACMNTTTTAWSWDQTMWGTGSAMCGDMTYNKDILVFSGPGKYKVTFNYYAATGCSICANTAETEFYILDRTLPDLTITNITFSNENPTEDDEITIAAQIQNSGNTNLNLTNINVSLYIDNFSKNSKILNLTNLAGKTVNFTWLAEQGTHEITIKIDPENRVGESDETNNELLKNLIVNQKSGDGDNGECPTCVASKPKSKSGGHPSIPLLPVIYKDSTDTKTYSECAACFENYGIAKDTVIFLYSKRCSHCAKAKPHIKDLEENLNYSFYWAEQDEDITYNILGCVEIVESGILPIFICPATCEVIYAETNKDKIKKFYDDCKNASEKVITFKPDINIFISPRVVNYTANFDIDVKNNIGRNVSGKLLIKIINISSNETIYESIENLTLAAFEKKNINFSWTGENGEYRIIIEYYLYSEVFIKDKNFKISVQPVEENISGLENHTGICIVYLYEPNCPSCSRVNPLISGLKEKYNLTIKSYNARENFDDAAKYFKNYNVSKNQRMVPAVFIGNRYFIDMEIDRNLENEILKYIKTNVRCGFVNESNESGIKINITQNITGNLTELSSYNFVVPEGKICLFLFMSPVCAECHAADAHIKKMEENYPQLEVMRFYINEPENREIMGKFCSKYNISPGTLAVFMGDRCFTDANSIKENLESEILNNIEGLQCPQIAETSENYWIEKFESFGIFTIIFAGLVDGVNPCAMAALIFFISYLSLIGRKGRDILLIGIIFTSAVFLTYLLIGLGFFEFITNAQDKLEIISKIIYLVAGICALIFCYFSITDYFKASSGKASKMTLQLPEKIKEIIHKIIRKQVRMKFFVAAAFITGFLVSLFEFLCTGQVYLPTILYILGIPELKAKALFYLILYNFMFILPLVAIFLAAYFGTTSKAISTVFSRNIPLIKILTAILFLILAVFMFILSAEMFGIL